MQKNYTIIDWSSHLPGPYACFQLASLGFRVIKPIKKNKLMPFQKIAAVHNLEPLNIFNFWFESFNQDKELFYYEKESELVELFQRADGIVTNRKSLPCETQAVITQIVSSQKDSYPKHDINAQAQARLLKTNSISSSVGRSNELPILPWVGIELANKVVQTHLFQLLKQQKSATVALDESAQELSRVLIPHTSSHLSSSHLHTGAFPCYQVYQLQDGSQVALGAVEEKYWKMFCEYFGLNFSAQDRFDLSGEVQKEIEVFFESLSLGHPKMNGETETFCLNLVK